MKLKAYLDHTGQTISSFARRLRVSHSVVSRIANDRRRPSAELLVAILRLSDGRVTPEDLGFPDRDEAS